MDKPNFDFIVADQLRADCLRFMGNPDVQTPHLDALAQQGRLYRNHIAQAPVCYPSRTALMTGRMPHSIGTFNNLVGVGAQEVSYVQLLADAGYHCASFGSNHMQPEPFGFHKVVTSRSNYPNSAYEKWLNELNLDIPVTDYHPQNALGNKHEIKYGLMAQDMKYHWDAFGTGRAIDYLPELKDRPFYLHLGFHLPHPPYFCDRHHFDLYDPAQIKIADYTTQFDRHPKLQAMYDGMGLGNVAEEEVREITAYYYGAISFVDAQIGRFLAALKEQGLDRNTHIIFTADHGHFCGQHGVFDKTTFPHEGLVHVPLVWVQPDDQKSEITGFTEHIDLAPAFLETAGVEVPYYMEGQNVLAAERDWAFSEVGDGIYQDPIQRYVKTGYYASCIDTQWQYIHSTVEGHSALYKRSEDPEGRYNVLADYPDVVAACKDRLLDRLLMGSIARQDNSIKSFLEFRSGQGMDLSVLD
jgi:arylsulfatase A-like enzyme